MDDLLVTLDNERWAIVRPRLDALSALLAAREIAQLRETHGEDAAIDGLVQLSYLIKSWNLTDDDGERLTLTPQSVREHLSLPELSAIAVRVREAIENQEAK